MPGGEARITPGFRLPARYVIHTAGPTWRGGTHGEADLLASCYRHSLALAREHRLGPIAFPAISCGVYGYPIDQAAAIAVREVRDSLAGEPRLARVMLVAFDDEICMALFQAVAALIPDS